MVSKVKEPLDELRLLADILDTLANTEQGVRPDQMAPLTQRLRRAADTIANTYTEKKSEVHKDVTEKDRPRRLDGLPELNLQARQSPGQIPLNSSRKPVVTKPSSVGAFPVPREKCPQGQLAISKEVSRCLACTLYNILEGATVLLKASFAHVFLRKDDEMVSIVNCSARLSFPPQLVRHKCLGSLDADVLASGIALNQKITDSSKTTSSLLIFPIFPAEPHSRGALAVVHVENKLQGSLPFNEADEGILLTTAQLIGGLMSRFPQMDWFTQFYDPVTQHILAPFVPRKKLPTSREGNTSGHQAFLTETFFDTDSSLDAAYLRKIEECQFPLLIRRECLPRLNSQKPLAQGLSTAPSLREVAAYVENMQSCWKRSVSNNVMISEEESSNQVELKVLRRELTRMRALFAEAEEQLRLYRLEGKDYEDEFRNIKSELDAFIRKRDKLDIT